MIHYQLKCDQGDKFDGWFRSSEIFEADAKNKKIECPCCGSKKVSRDIMAPNVSKGAQEQPRQPTAAERRAFEEGLREQRRLIEANADNVGTHLAEVTHRMLDGKESIRSIYGDATREQKIGLRERGAPIREVPWPDLNPKRPANAGKSRDRKPGRGNGSH